MEYSHKPTSHILYLHAEMSKLEPFHDKIYIIFFKKFFESKTHFIFVIKGICTPLQMPLLRVMNTGYGEAILLEIEGMQN